MQIIPAIDIKNGKCVRLFQGDYDKETIYSGNPIEMALKWKNQGAEMVHIVDLDGAKVGASKIMGIVKKIIKKVNIPVEIGGGIRDVQSINRLYILGVDRVIIGTMALTNKKLLKKAIELFGKKILVSLDTKNRRLLTNGWTQQSSVDLITVINRLEKLDVKTIIYTDTTRDGTLTEPNYNSIKFIRKNTKMKLIVAGGISSIDQIKKLQKLKVDGVIIGKALYEGKINLKEAIEYVN